MRDEAIGALLATYFKVAYYMSNSLTLKMEAKCSSETSVGFQWTTRRYIPEDRTLCNSYSFFYHEQPHSGRRVKGEVCAT
jgi:hypothetical protein